MSKPNAPDLTLTRKIRALILAEPQTSFTAEDIAKRLAVDTVQTQASLDYLADLTRECEQEPELKGIAEVLLRGESRFEALVDNPDVRRDYDFRAVNEGGRDLCPKNMFYYVWAWLNMLERRCREDGVESNRTILITHDCRYYPPKIIAAAVTAARLRGYTVVFAYADDGIPSSVSSYSHAVRLVRPMMALFITASHVSRPVENTVVGAKVSMRTRSPKLESLATKDIKITTANELQALKSRDDLHLLVKPIGEYNEISVLESHTRLAAAAVNAVLGYFPGVTLHSLSQRLKEFSDLDEVLKTLPIPDNQAPLGQLKVVIEAAHTSSGLIADRAFKSLGAQTTVLNGDVLPIQGFHTADPSIKENLIGMFDVMTKQGAQMGLGFDLDGDRGAIVLPLSDGQFAVLAPDKLGQVLMPFLMKEGGYSETPKPLYVRDCLSTDALVDQGKLSDVTVDTTDAGYVFLKKRESERSKEGYIAIGMGEASGHAWLDYTGPFENPIVVAALFAAMCVNRLAAMQPGGDITATAFEKIYTEAEIPYRKAIRFQPLFSPVLIAAMAASPENETGWKPQDATPIPQRLITLCKSASIRKLQEFFQPQKTFGTPVGELKVDQFEAAWDEDEKMFRFGKIYFSMDGVPLGSFVSRGSSNDPTAVQVWEVREFGSGTWDGVRLPEDVIQKRFDLVGGIVLAACEELGILELADRRPAANMGEVLPSVGRYREMMKGFANS